MIFQVYSGRDFDDDDVNSPENTCIKKYFIGDLQKNRNTDLKMTFRITSEHILEAECLIDEQDENGASRTIMHSVTIEDSDLSVNQEEKQMLRQKIVEENTLELVEEELKNANVAHMSTAIFNFNS